LGEILPLERFSATELMVMYNYDVVIKDTNENKSYFHTYLATDTKVPRGICLNSSVVDIVRTACHGQVRFAS
jgi:hypothetical protein